MKHIQYYMMIKKEEIIIFNIFLHIDLNENDIFINHYYERIIQSNEYKLFHLLYQSLLKRYINLKIKNKLQRKISKSNNRCGFR